MVTSRSSGSSFLNRVELQNECLALGLANLFIPSTLCGSNIDPATGKIHRERFVSHMKQATEVYINGSPCGEINIHLFKGADSSANQASCVHLMHYLKGTKAQKERLMQEHREVNDNIERIWTIRNDHMVQDLPTQYAFVLVCCYKPGCTHPVCSDHNPAKLPVWYSGGPCVLYLPLPDPQRPWGKADCDACGGQCHGHFLNLSNF